MVSIWRRIKSKVYTWLAPDESRRADEKIFHPWEMCAFFAFGQKLETEFKGRGIMACTFEPDDIHIGLDTKHLLECERGEIEAKRMDLRMIRILADLDNSTTVMAECRVYSIKKGVWRVEVMSNIQVVDILTTPKAPTPKDRHLRDAGTMSQNDIGSREQDSRIH